MVETSDFESINLQHDGQARTIVALADSEEKQEAPSVDKKEDATAASSIPDGAVVYLTRDNIVQEDSSKVNFIDHGVTPVSTGILHGGQ